ncbi:hypothetical protein E2I00_003017, partial [Balaenoptera physalus]
MSTVSALSSGTQAVLLGFRVTSPEKLRLRAGLGVLFQTPLLPFAGCSASGYLPASLAWHPQQSEVFVFGNENGTVSLVDTKSASCALSSAVHSQCVTGLVFSPH